MRRTVDTRPLLASASADRTVRLWDPATAAGRLTLPVRAPALAVSECDHALGIGVQTGVVVVDIVDA